MKIEKITTIISSIIIEVLLLVGLLGVGLSTQNISIPKWLESIVDNWLILLLKINLRFENITSQSLQELHIIDFIFLLFIGMIFIRLMQRLRAINRVFTYLAVLSPPLGAFTLWITKTAGRSGLLIGALIFSIIMLWSNEYSKALSIIGLGGSVFLFIGGDIGTTFFPPNIIVSAMIMNGYILWIIWYGGILFTELRN